ncbi:uncharacterized protein LOC141853269 [Brevipalpus obovatus]|uniref:uncharacterized protein LOC141853269 n=1 Tax=Brevipalpus obovatus TaxID=246614 RepID=UPI003D9DD6CD
MPNIFHHQTSLFPFIFSIFATHNFRYGWTLSIGLLIVLLLSTCVVDNVMAIKLLDVQVPKNVRKGADVNLNCLYQLERDTLLKIRWTFNGSDFYQYGPKFNPVMQTFNVPGINVDESKSSDGHVTLRRVSLNATGWYKCEITSEKNFQTLFVQRLMQVGVNNGIQSQLNIIPITLAEAIVTPIFSLLIMVHLIVFTTHSGYLTANG